MDKNIKNKPTKLIVKCSETDPKKIEENRKQFEDTVVNIITE